MKPASTLSNLLTCLILSASAAFVSSCRDYEPYSDQRLQDVAYTHEFERQFGKIDPEQTWDLFGQLARRRHIGTRAGTDNQYYNNVIVTDPFVTNQSFPNIGSPSDTVWITRADNQEYNKVLPEGAGGSLAGNANLTYEQTNLGRVVQDFVATAHEFYIAPVHWTTSGQDWIGIYWYTDKENEADVTVMGHDGELYWLVLKPIIQGKTHLRYQNSANPNSQIHNISSSEENCGYVFGQGADHLVSYRVHVKVPEEIPFYGFYMDNQNNWGGGIQFSESKLNDYLIGFPNFVGHDVSYVATFNIQRDIDADYKDNRDYLCFEDWMHNGDFDLNDLVFRVEGFDNQSVVESSEVDESAILVCEDLKQFDFDFNDIVLELNYTQEIKRHYDLVGDNFILNKNLTDTIAELTITPFAAGGAYESTLTIGGTAWDEIHALLNEYPALPEGSKDHQIINAGEHFTDPHSTPMVLTKTKTQKELPDRILVNGQNKYPTYLSQLFAEGFFTIVSREDGQAEKIISSKPQTGSADGYYYQEGYAPQMMLLPNYFEWPRELKRIDLAYSSFQEWVSDITQTDWIVNSQEPDLITERGNIGPNDPTAPTPVDQSIVLTHRPTGEITLNNAHYNNSVLLDFEASGIEALSYDSASAKLNITYSSLPQSSFVIYDKNGGYILTHEHPRTDNQSVVTYSISATNFKKALTHGGIYIVSDDAVNITNATIDIHNITTKAHHKLYVDPLYMTFETMNTQTITATSPTAKPNEITFTSSDESVATVSSTGVVTPVAEGYCSIVVRAAESVVAGKTYNSSSERVSIEVITGTPNRVILKLGPTQNIAGATGNLTNYALCTTGRDAMDSWNSATLTVTKTAGNAASFQIQSLNGDVLGTANNVNGTATFNLNSDQLDLCRNNSNGAIYTFKILHSENTYIQAAVLDRNN